MYITLRGINFAGIKFRGTLHPRNFDTFAGILFRGRTISEYFCEFRVWDLSKFLGNAVFGRVGWNKKNKNQLRNKNDFYV